MTHIIEIPYREIQRHDAYTAGYENGKMFDARPTIPYSTDKTLRMDWLDGYIDGQHRSGKNQRSA